MSLDVDLTGVSYKVKCECPTCGDKHESTRRDVLFSYNITHNLNTMADRAGIYEHLWRPEEIDIHKASQLIEPLEQGLKKLIEEPEYFKKFNPENGWGDYDGLVRFVRAYLDACREYPNAEIGVSR